MESISEEYANELKDRIQRDLSVRLPDMSSVTLENRPSDEVLASYIGELIDIYTQNISLTSGDKNLLTTDIINDFVKFGPIQPLLEDERITEVMVNGFDGIYVEMEGRLYKVDNIKFKDNAHVRRIIDRIAQGVNRHCDEQSPYMDARLPDGSRVNATIPPVSVDFPTITIRKFSKSTVEWEDLFAFGSLSEEMRQFLHLCVVARCNILVSGGTGSGKTTLLNVLSNDIPADQRIITIEDSAELKLRQPHVVRLETRSKNTEGAGEINVHKLLVNSLRMRPDRIVVGECRSTETLEMLQAMSTGHDGSLSTIHANDPATAFSRIETMVLEANSGLPSRAIRQQIVQAIDLIVHTSRMVDGSRKIVSITCVDPTLEGEVIKSGPVFEFVQTGLDQNGRVMGKYVGRSIPTQNILDKIHSVGLDINHGWFIHSDDYDFLH